MDGFKKLPKYKTGGLVKTPVTGDKKADAPSKAAQKPALKGSDVAKEKSKPAGTKDYGIKSKEAGPAESPSAATKGRSKKEVGSVKKFKTGGGVKKYEDGGSVLGGLATRLRNNVMGTPAQNAAALAREVARKKAMAAAAATGQGVANAANQAGIAQALPPTPQAAPTGSAPAIPGGQKRGGKVKKAC